MYYVESKLLAKPTHVYLPNKLGIPPDPNVNNDMQIVVGHCVTAIRRVSQGLYLPANSVVDGALKRLEVGG